MTPAKKKVPEPVVNIEKSEPQVNAANNPILEILQNPLLLTQWKRWYSRGATYLLTLRKSIIDQLSDYTASNLLGYLALELDQTDLAGRRG